MSQDLNSLLPPTPQTPGDLVPPDTSVGGADELKLELISHSQIFYYWPLWLISLVFAGITAMTGKEVTMHFFEKGASTATALANKGEVIKIKMSTSPSLGLAFIIILMVVILFTSVNIRGVWAALVAASFVIIGLVFSLMGWWRPILGAIVKVNFFLNMQFYLWTGVVLFVIWALVVFVYDKRHYIVLRSAQFTIVEEVGEGEKNFDTMGLVLDKQRDNFFQHWLLGFGSGDLKITTAGGASKQIYFPNVLFINSKLKKSHQILQGRGRA